MPASTADAPSDETVKPVDELSGTLTGTIVAPSARSSSTARVNSRATGSGTPAGALSGSPSRRPLSGAAPADGSVGYDGLGGGPARLAPSSTSGPAIADSNRPRSPALRAIGPA